GFVDEKDSVEGGLADVEGLDRRLADIAGDKPAAIDLDHMAFSQHPERAVDVPERSRYDGLAHPRRAREHHMPADRRDLLPLLTPLPFYLQARQQLVHFLLDGAKPDHGVEVVQSLLGGAFLFRLRRHLERAQRAALFLSRSEESREIAHLQPLEIGG